jgi:predicted O-methyltransferase YrrM
VRAPIDLDSVTALYRRYARDLERVRAAQRRLYARRGDVHLERFALYRLLSGALGALGLPAHYKRRLKPQLDDIESEITYLLLRDASPRTVVEIGADRGWSTSWMLHALRDNAAGHLYSYDLYDYSARAVPGELAAGRWTLVPGDATAALDRLPAAIDLLFIDAAHTPEFAHWYLAKVLPRLSRGTPVAIHDIFPPPEKAHRAREGPAVRAWLEERRVPHFTASPAAAPEVHERLVAVKRELGLADPIHWSRANPMVFFRAP